MAVASVVEIEGLSKRYGFGTSAVLALDGLDFNIERGGVFGLLGPNGAGKSTLLRILSGLVHPSAGDFRLFGLPPSPTAFRRLGALIETPRFPPYLTGLEILEMLARTSGVADAQCRQLLDRVGLGQAGDRRASGYSLGMKQRLGIATTLVGRPELIILDEPTNGMDPGGIQEIRGLVRTLAEEDGLTVILSSHLLDEVQRTCDRVAILNRGKVAAAGSLDDLLGRRERLRIEAEPLDQALAIAGTSATREGDALLAAVSRGEAPALFAALTAAGVRLFEARWERNDLEAIFFAETEGS